MLVRGGGRRRRLREKHGVEPRATTVREKGLCGALLTPFFVRIGALPCHLEKDSPGYVASFGGELYKEQRLLVRVFLFLGKCIFSFDFFGLPLFFSIFFFLLPLLFPPTPTPCLRLFCVMLYF